MAKQFDDIVNQGQDTPAGEGSKSASIEAEGKDPAVQPESAAGAEPVASELKKLQTQLAEKEKEIAELKDKYLRGMAETDNVRKRLRQQSEENVRRQREGLLREVLPIVDNLERAVEAARGGGNGKPIVEGVEMVLRAMLDFLKAQGVSQMNTLGQPFDPQCHEAVDHVASAEHPPNTVVTEFNRGYQMGERLLRPARVSVAKPAGSGTGNDRKNGGDEVENG
jgi:molecular chaperone GrpE